MHAQHAKYPVQNTAINNTYEVLSVTYMLYSTAYSVPQHNATFGGQTTMNNSTACDMYRTRNSNITLAMGQYTI